MSKDASPAENHAQTGVSPAADKSNAEAEDAGIGPHGLAPPPLDLMSPQFTLRAVLTGMFLAGLLSCCNIYTGLKIGWSINMSITAALVGYGFWMSIHGVFRVRKWGILENNINQTACSSGASVSSAGLVAAVPALAMVTGQTLDWHYLALWIFSVCLVGITVAIALRRQVLLVDKLPFATGIASAETLRELYGKGSEAMKRVAMLASAAVLASPILCLTQYPLPFVGRKLPRAFPIGMSIKGFSAKSLTFGFDATLLMYAIGGLVGIRTCVSILIGSVLAWAVLAPNLIESGHLRLTVSEPLDVLPEDVRLLPEPQGYARYEVSRHLLRWKGVMSADQRDDLLAQSDDPFYQEAVKKLYIRSQLEPSAWPGEEAAYTTTRRLRISEPLDTFPKGFTIGWELTAFVRYDKKRQALMAIGPVSDARRDALMRQAGEFARQNPDQKAACGAFAAALRRLHARSAGPFLPAGAEIPPELKDVITHDAVAKTLRATGPLGNEVARLLRNMVPEGTLGCEPFQASVGALVAGSRLTPATPNYRDLVTWLLWPGATLMVIASLTSFAFSWRSILGTFVGHKRQDTKAGPPDTGEVTRKWFVAALVLALVLSVTLQISLFKILWWAAVAGVLLTFLLAIVAARVAGETNITPVGAMGKVTQLVFGAMVSKATVPHLSASGLMSANLMAASVTGGAASQCADLLHDLRCGQLIGASPRLQALAQICGAFAGAMVGSAVYLILIPDPTQQLMTEEWAAPAVVAWKAVAELFAVGFDAIPVGAPLAMLIAAVAAIVLVVVEKAVPRRVRPFMLSPASLGLAFVIHAHTSVTMFVGAVIALLLSRLFKNWTTRFLVTICAGVIAGESITGVSIALCKILAP